MSKRETYEQRTEELISPIIEQNQFELVDVEYVKEGGTWYLRAYIDKPGGITVDDCEVVSRALSDLLDKHDFIEDAYVLEVSSPGLGRPLKKEKDFARSIGEEVDVRTFRAISHQKEFTGILRDYDKEKIVLEDVYKRQTLQRYKGLGEMDAEQLWETTLNPETRMMQRVEIEDARLASNVTRMLMGTEVPPRKEFIHEHAQDALLDV